jgi:hypothetical protein
MKQTVLTLLVFAALAAPAAAQSRPRPKSEPAIFHVFGLFDYSIPAATKSFDAVFGSSQLLGFGGGADVDVWHHLFLRIAVSQARRTGSRVFVDDTGDVFTLNIPMKVTMTPIEGGAGARFPSKSRATPYIGAAFVSLGYQETSDFAQSADFVSERYMGAEAFGGVDVKIGKHLLIGGEAQYRHIGVPEVSTSVMKQFNDTDLGGFTARVLIGFTSR